MEFAATSTHSIETVHSKFEVFKSKLKSKVQWETVESVGGVSIMIGLSDFERNYSASTFFIDHHQGGEK